MNPGSSPGLCIHCGYDRTGLELNARCPECGGLSPVGGVVRYLDQPTHLLVRTAMWLGGVAFVQLLTLVIVVSIFTPSPMRFRLVMAGMPIAMVNLLLRSSRRLHEPKSARRPGNLVVMMMLVIFIWVTAVAFFGAWGWLDIAIPIILAFLLAFGVRGSMSTARWIQDDVAEGFQQYGIWPPVIAAIIAVAAIWTGRSWDVVTIFALGFLGWWLIQLIADLILAWTSIVAIGHRHKLDGIEARRRDREDEWARER